MNEENGKVPENATEEKSGDTHPPVPVVNTAESCEEGPKGTEQGKETTSLHHISRWNRFREWLFKITVAELGMFLLTFVIAGSSIYYTKYAKRQWKVMRDQLPELHTSAEAAEHAALTAAAQLELTQRPWVSAGIAIDGPFDFTVNGANVHLKLRLQNTGPSPALNTVVEGIPVDSFFGGSPDALQVREERCNAATAMIKKFTNQGVALFPNNTFEQTWTWTFPQSDLAKYHGTGSRMPGVIVWPSIVICIGYQPTFDQAKVYHTSYIVNLLKVDPVTKLPGVNFKIGEDIPGAQLFLRFDNHGAIKAD